MKTQNATTGVTPTNTGTGSSSAPGATGTPTTANTNANVNDGRTTLLVPNARDEQKTV